jgi:type IV pilus assembly protein PilQ
VKKTILLLLFLLSASILSAQVVSDNIKTLLSSEGNIMYGDEPNSIVVTDYAENIQRITDYLNLIDVSPKQVLIEARVVEAKLQKENSLGINWKIFADKGYIPVGRFKVGTSSTLGSRPGPLEQVIPYKNTFYPPAQTAAGQETPFTIAIFDDNINAIVQTLASSMDTDILSAPRVTTVNNREAEIKVIQRLPWAEPQVQVSGDSGAITVTWKINFEEVGIILKVTPMINDDGNISMILKPEVSEKTADYNLTVTQGTTSVPYTVPIIDTRSASTKVVIGNGQTLIIGGLIKQKNTKGESKIPFFGDIPVLGYLFKSKKDIGDKTELLIFVSPTVITSNEMLHMARQEKYGVGGKYRIEAEALAKKQMDLETKEKIKKDTYAVDLDVLTKKQDALLAESKALEKDISSEEENLKNLQDTKTALLAERKELEKTEGN